MRKLLLVGVGRHAKRVYLPLLASRRQQVVGVLDLESRRGELEQVFAGWSLELSFLPDEPSDVRARLKALHHRLGFDALLISTDPRHRDVYFDFALEHGLAVFVDKPVFALDGVAVSPARALEYGRRLVELSARVQQSRIDFVVQAQRRAHVGYRFVKALIDDAVIHGLPVTTLHVQHADGMWVLPDEWEREYHPYKYGFGKLLHSGYHFVDVLTQLLAGTFVANKVNQVDLAVRARMGGISSEPKYGERDVNALLDFRNPERTVCVASLDLLQGSLSDRDPSKAVSDSYKGIGRVRHERVDVKCSHALNVQIHSYQSSSTRQPAGTAVGEVDHFDILVFRNPTLLSGPAFEKHSVASLSAHDAEGHNERARAALLTAFLDERPTGSELSSHRLTGALLALLYEAIAESNGRLALKRAVL